MKRIYRFIGILFTIIIFMSCVKEEMITVDPGFILTFQRDGKANALAGSTFYVIPTGSGEFLTLFDGTTGHVWGEPGAKGTDFNKADSLAVQYKTSGTYKLSLVSTSSGNFGKEVSREVKTVDVTAIDDRNSFTVFNINAVDGVISETNEISFSVPSSVTDFNFKVIFVLDSELSRAYVNGVEQASDTSVNDFSQPVIYTVVSSQGTEKQYTVKFSVFAASSEKKILKFSLGVGGNGEVGVIDEISSTINLTSNYATNLASVRLVLESSYACKIYLNNALFSDRKGYNLSSTGLSTIKVVAQDNSEREYSIVTQLDKPVYSFSFLGLIPAPVGIIDEVAKTISVDVLKGTDVTTLVAVWTGSVGKVTVGSTIQTNEITSNDFTAPLTYTFYKGSTAGDQYVVTVNVK